jgi:hypothetical protein
MPPFTQLELLSWLEEHEGKLQLQQFPWPTQSPDMNINETLWSVLENRARNRFMPSTSLKELKDFLHEEWYKILLDWSKLVQVQSKKNYGCTEAKRWSDTILTHCGPLHKILRSLFQPP